MPARPARQDMRPVVTDPGLTFTALVRDLERAPNDADRGFVRDQIVVKLRQRIRRIEPDQRERLEAALGPLAALADRLKAAPPAEALQLFCEQRLWRPRLAGRLY
jgi:type I restriction enzyme R subunit